MSLTTLAKIEEVKKVEKDGWKGPGWFVTANGESYATFVPSIGEKAQAAEGQTATIFYDKTPRGNKLENVEVDSTPQPVSHQKPDGSVDWDLKGLHITRTALWKSAIEAIAGPNIEAKAVAAFARELVLAAELDIFHRAPAQVGDDIPF